MTEFIIKYRWFIICIFIALGVTFGALIPLSETDPEIRNYVPQSMKSRIETDKIENEFGVQDMVLILFSDSTILTSQNLNQIKAIDRDVSKLSGVTSRISPFTIRSIRSTEGEMTALPLIKRVPENDEGFLKLREDVLTNRFAKDIVISSDLTTASITATINTSVQESVTLHKIDSIITIHSGQAKVLTGGLPYIRQHIMKDVNKDAIFLIPAALIIMLLVLKLTLGEWKSVFMPFTVVLLTTVISMGLIPLLGWKLSIISLLVPIILVAVANNYGIYLVARFQEISRRNKDASRISQLKELLGTLNMPILFSGLTTIAGILGLLTHSVSLAKQVGILAAVGVSIALVMSLLFIPALIYFRKDPVRDIKPVSSSGGKFEKTLSRLSDFIIRYPGKIIFGSVFFTLAISAGFFLLRIETNQEKYFPKSNAVRLASDVINTKFGGSQTISVMISGDIKDPVVMKGIDNLTLEVEKIDGVGKVFSISQAVREMSKAIYNTGEEGYDRIPLERDGIAQMFELYNMSGDPDDFKQLMDPANTKAHILIKLSNPENRVINSVKEKITELMTGFPAEVTIGGYAIIMADFARLVVRGQVSSLLFALITVFILLTIIFRSVKGGLLGSVPLAASILILFGFMGFAGIALDAATALLSSIMIGVGVDFTIQYIWCYNLQINKGLSVEDATRASHLTIGRSIIINGLSVMAGFSALMFSGFTSIRFFGYLVLISIGSCLAGAIILIPAILVKFRPGFVENDMSKTKIIKHENENRIINVTDAAFTGISAAARCRPDFE
jgi:hydrophobe/amphiphile efflux-3 (HAE3) family protein